MHDNLDTDMLNATKHCNANSLIAYVHMFNVLARCCRAQPIDHFATSVWILKVTLFVLSFELKNKQAKTCNGSGLPSKYIVESTLQFEYSVEYQFPFFSKTTTFFFCFVISVYM